MTRRHRRQDAVIVRAVGSSMLDLYEEDELGRWAVVGEETDWV